MFEGKKLNFDDYISKEEIPKISNLGFSFKKLVKEEQIKPGTSIREKIINVITDN